MNDNEDLRLRNMHETYPGEFKHRVTELEDENERLRERVADLETQTVQWVEYCAQHKKRVAELEARVEELCWALFDELPQVAERDVASGWRTPLSRRTSEIDACRELERLGKLEKHPEHDWWRRKDP